MKCINCDKDVEDNTVLCPFCHSDALEANKSTDACDTKKKDYKQKLIGFGVPIVISIFIIIIIICCIKSKPPGMSEQTYKAGCEIVELTDKYLDFELSKSEAYNQISEIDDRIHSDGSPENLGVSIYASAIAFNLSSPYPDDDEILNDRNSLAKELGLSTK